MKNFSVVKNFKWFAAVSVLLVAVGLISLVLLPFGVTWFNFDIDFIGGTTMQYSISGEISHDTIIDIERIVGEASGVSASVQRSGDAGQLLIKTVDIDSETRDAVHVAIVEAYPDAVRLSVDNISPSVGNDLRRAAIVATVLAAVLMLVYITIRFDFRSGLAAVAALVHDLLLMLSAYVILQIPMNMSFIAAILTILGYSINATIIIFDRVRENKKIMGKSHFTDIVDASIRQTATRNINTSLTTLFPVVLLIIFGVSSIREFAIPLMVGIISGAYSSMFISGPLWVLLSKKEK